MIASALHEACILVLLFSGVPLLASAATGLIVSVFQAATQIQEQTVAYVVKLVSVLVCLYLGGAWGWDILVRFLQQALAAVIVLGRG